MRLPADEQAAAEARRFARNWGVQQALPGRLVDDLELVVAELVSNAVRHGVPPYEIELSASDGVVAAKCATARRCCPCRRRVLTNAEGSGWAS